MSSALEARLAQEMARKVAIPIAERVAQETAVPVARETATTVAEQTAQDAADAFHTANPPIPGPRGSAGATGGPGPAGVDGEPGPKGDKGLNWRGPWQRGAYQPDDAVEADGSSYVATAQTRSKPPSSSWDLLAQKGEPGAPGSDGQFHAYPRGGGGVTVQDEGTNVGPVSTLDFEGAGVTVTQPQGGKAVVTIPGGGTGSALEVFNQGTPLDTAVSSLDFTGPGVTASVVGHAVTVSVAAGGGQGLTFAWPVIMADCQAFFVGTSDDPLPSYTYDNGPLNDGVGSTVTADANGAFVPDGSYAAQVGDRIGVANLPGTFFGIFTVTDLGSVSSPWVLTRATDADTQATFCRQWAVRATNGDTYDGGMLRSYSIEDPLNLPSVDSYSNSERFMVQTSTGGMALGSGAMAVGASTLALGSSAVAGALSGFGVAIGRATAIGADATATALGATAVGASTMATADYATAIGTDTVASDVGVTVINGPNGVSIPAAVVLMANLPTADPAAVGQLWNNLGVLMVSAG